MTFFAKIAKRILKSSSKLEPSTVLAQFAETFPNEYGQKQHRHLPLLCRNIQEVPLEQQEDVKTLTDQQPKSCPDQPGVPLQNLEQSSLPNEEWMCIDCGEKEKLYILIEKDRPDTVKLLDKDLVVCETCGFRMHGSTMNAWFFNRNKIRKRRSSKTKE
jgi:hypothetical protein